MVAYTISTNDLQIKDSYLVSKHDFETELLWVKNDEEGNADSLVWNRSIASMRREWATHNAFYCLGILRSHTKDVDLNYPQKWYEKIGYCVVGRLVMPFIG